MKEKIGYSLVSFVFLLASLLTIEKYSDLVFIPTSIILPIIIFLIPFCVFILFVSRDKKNVKYFSFIFLLISIYLVLDMLPFLFLSPLSFFIISYLPFLIFNFFITFNFIIPSSLLNIVSKLLFLQSSITLVLLCVNFKHFYWVTLVTISLSLICCIVLYLKEKDHLSTKTRREQTFLIRSLVLALSPFILSYSLFKNVLPNQIKMYSLFFILIIPATIGIILLNRNDLSKNKKILVVNAITHTINICILYIVSTYFFHFTLFRTYYVFFLYYFIVSMFYSKNLYLNQIEAKKIRQTKNSFRKEKLALIQDISKEKALSSISDLISRLLLENYKINSHLLVWKDQYHPYILSSKGDLSKFYLTKKSIISLKSKSELFSFDNNEFKKFTFRENEKILGWLIIGNEKNIFLAEKEYEAIRNISSIIGEIIIESERLYDIKQESSRLESIPYDEYLNYEYLNMVQNFHKDFSFFIHDNVLQNILALKKLTESLNTTHIETKNLIMETFDDLNRIFRNKMFELYPPTIDKVPLSQSVIFLCNKLNGEAKNKCITFHCPQEIHLEKEEKFHVYRIIQELLVNALKHSSATKINTTLIQNEFYIEIVVEDNGIGFDYKVTKLTEFENKHFGILSINQEVNSLNGKMKVFSTKPHGTKFMITIPTIKETKKS